MKFNSSAEVTVQVKIRIQKMWGDQFTLAEIARLSKETAFQDLRNALGSKTVLNEASLNKIRERIRVDWSGAELNLNIEERNSDDR